MKIYFVEGLELVNPQLETIEEIEATAGFLVKANGRETSLSRYIERSTQQNYVNIHLPFTLVGRDAEEVISLLQHEQFGALYADTIGRMGQTTTALAFEHITAA